MGHRKCTRWEKCCTIIRHEFTIDFWVKKVVYWKLFMIMSVDVTKCSNIRTTKSIDWTIVSSRKEIPPRPCFSRDSGIFWQSRFWTQFFKSDITMNRVVARNHLSVVEDVFRNKFSTHLCRGILGDRPIGPMFNVIIFIGKFFYSCSGISWSNLFYTISGT